MFESASSFRYTVLILFVLVMYMFYILLAEVSIDIQTECNIIQNIIRESEENYPENIESFLSRRNTVVVYIDDILIYLKKIIDENEKI